MRAILVCLLFVPAAMAGSVPEILFLAPGSTPFEGEMQAEQPTDLNASASLVLPGEQAALRFLDGGEHPAEVLGPLLVGAWLGPSGVVSGNLTAVVYDGDMELGRASYDVALDPEGIDPMSLIPPDPSDPEAAAAYIAAQAMMATMQPPMLMDLGLVEGNVTGPLSLSFYLEGEPIALGAATLQYDGALAPSFLYVPFYEPDPTQDADDDSGAGDDMGDDMDDDKEDMDDDKADDGDEFETPTLGDQGGVTYDESEDTPGLGMIALLGLVGLLGAIRRYKS